MEAMMSTDHNYSSSSCSSYSWWFHSHSNDRIPRRSPWLNATLADLDETTMAMLNIIEEDADTFAKRAEMYYKKRPELIRVIEHMYLSHRSLAEQFDQLKSESGLIGKLLEPNLSKTSSDKSYDVYSVESFDDPNLEQEEEEEEEEEEEVHLDAGKEQEEEAEEKIRKLREEIEGIKEEKERMKDELDEKNEEKREVIRQLSMALDMVMEENVMLKRKLASDTKKEMFVNRSSSSSSGGRSTVLMELERLKNIFLENLFNGTRTKTLNYSL